MNRKIQKLLRITGALHLILATFISVIAQENEDKLFDLSPFVVTSADNAGYAATNTLSGTRIKSSLRDIASSIQVVTEEFVEDTGVTSLEEILIYTTNSESAGVFGNFADPSPNGSRSFFGVDSNRDSASGQVTRLRGLAEADISRNLFRSNIPMDTYNISRVEINRGASSILFGTGSPAGIINYQIQEAMWRNQNKVSFRIDDEGSVRTVLDVNQVVLDDQLAIRIIGLKDNHKFKQDPAFRDDDRVYLAVTAKPLEWTTITGNFEKGSIRSTLPRISPPTDYFTNWYDFGKPTIPLNGDERDGTTQNFLNTHMTSSAETVPILVDAVSGTPDPSETGFARIGVTRFYFGGIPNGQAERPTDWRKKYASFNSTRAILDALIGRPENQDKGFVSTSGENIPLQIIDPTVFDFYNNVLDGRQSWNDMDFQSWNLSFRQTSPSGNFGVELSINNEEFSSMRNDALDSIRGYVLQIDSNEGGWQFNDPADVNSGETINPYFGRVYFGSRSVYNYDNTERTSKRFTGFARHDFASGGNGKDSLIRRILGSHTLTGMAEEVETDGQRISGRSTGFDPGSWGETLGLTGNNLSITGRSSAGVIFYISDDVSNRSTASGLNLKGYKGPRYYPNQVEADYWDADKGQIVRGTFLMNTIEDGFDLTNTGAGLFKNTIQSEAVVMQSKWFDDIFVTTAGRRWDEVSTIGNGPQLRRETGSIILSSLSLDDEESTQPSTKTDSVSGVFKVSRLLGRHFPSSMDLDLHYGKSENFRTSGGNLYAAKANGKLFPGQAGETEEMGFTVSLFDGRLTARANWYETRQSNISDEDANSIVRAYRQIMDAVYLNNTLSEIQSAGFSIPDHWRTDFGFTIIDNGDGTGTFDVDPTANTNRGDVESGVAEGFELEMIYNITNRWRFLANVAKTESVTTGAGTNMESDVNFVRQNWIENASVANLWTDPSGPGAGTLGTVGGFAADRVTGPFDTLLSLNGLSASEVREWRGNLITTYEFADDTILEGVFVGAGMRYQSGINLGYRYEEKPDGSRGADLNSPIEGPSETNFDFWIGYERPIWNNRVNWRLQLNIRNVFTGDELLPIGAQANDNYSLVPEFSEHAKTDYRVFRIAPPRVIQISSVFEF